MNKKSSDTNEIVRLVKANDIKILNLCHIPEDCRLKTLSIAVKDQQRLQEIFQLGERVDGSSLFSFIDPSISDIYIMPRAETAFTNPFAEVGTLNVLCDYLDSDGKPLDIAPQNVLQRAEEELYSSIGVSLRALFELEFYLIAGDQDPIFSSYSEKNYHESKPFARFEDLRNAILIRLANVGVATKYGHAEVGRFRSKTGCVMEQHEVEFLPHHLGRTAETVTIAKWLIRNMCLESHIYVSFSPKPALEHAGNGMHLHFGGIRNGQNTISDSAGNLTNEAKQMIGGILRFARSLTAFGNMVPPSYLRLISRRESPINICWGAKDRLALLRIPLWWNFSEQFSESESCLRTLEFRAPDPSASTYLLLAGIVVATEYGLRHPKTAIRTAEELASKDRKKRDVKPNSLPESCSESADCLLNDRRYYEARGVFPASVIDGVVAKLTSYKDRHLWKRMAKKPDETERLLSQYLDCG